MASKHQLKNKIRVTANIKQITRAMQMVAAAKMRKSEGVALRARPYAKKALALLRNVLRYALGEELTSPYFGARKGAQKICFVVVTSDRGLCGAYNSGVLRAATKFIESHRDAELLHVLPIGRKAKEFFAKRPVELRHGAGLVTMPNAFTNFSEIATLYDAKPVSDWLIKQYQDGVYTNIVFCSTNFVSALLQRVEIHEVLPLTFPELERIVAGIVPKAGLYAELAKAETDMPERYYKFEPSYQKVFETLVLALLKVEILHLIFESNASEHAARMVAMKSATENAENIMKTLQQALNKARQESITQELVEMASAKDAMAA
ncbi:MAG: ATP synthase F1 subunit gamma [Candidatus Harrisonbacteria bacterium]|nr:ATP synthase F1 subunit gamma [Candidatus Harrisonbacteria bacterium]